MESFERIRVDISELYNVAIREENSFSILPEQHEVINNAVSQINFLVTQHSELTLHGSTVIVILPLLYQLAYINYIGHDFGASAVTVWSLFSKLVPFRSITDSGSNFEVYVRFCKLLEVYCSEGIDTLCFEYEQLLVDGAEEDMLNHASSVKLVVFFAVRITTLLSYVGNNLEKDLKSSAVIVLMRLYWFLSVHEIPLDALIQQKLKVADMIAKIIRIMYFHVPGADKPRCDDAAFQTLFYLTAYIAKPKVSLSAAHEANSKQQSASFQATCGVLFALLDVWHRSSRGEKTESSGEKVQKRINTYSSSNSNSQSLATSGSSASSSQFGEAEAEAEAEAATQGQGCADGSGAAACCDVSTMLQYASTFVRLLHSIALEFCGCLPDSVFAEVLQRAVRCVAEWCARTGSHSDVRGLCVRVDF
jgi:hypothetical protein